MQEDGETEKKIKEEWKKDGWSDEDETRNELSRNLV